MSGMSQRNRFRFRGNDICGSGLVSWSVVGGKGGKVGSWRDEGRIAGQFSIQCASMTAEYRWCQSDIGCPNTNPIMQSTDLHYGIRDAMIRARSNKVKK
jgi:hypothetical protein